MQNYDIAELRRTRVVKKRDYVRFDEREDVIVSVELAALVADKVRREPSYWKWLIIAIHGALQGALVCALSGSDETGALSKKSAEAWRNYLESATGRFPNTRLAEFPELLKRASDAHQMTHNRLPPLKLAPDEFRDLQKLHKELRNGFMHFSPKGWSVEAAGLPRMILTALSATEHLFEHAIAGRVSGNQKRRFSRSIAAVRQSLLA